MKNNTLIWLLAIFAVLVVITVIQYKDYHKEAIAPVIKNTASTSVPVTVTTTTTSTTTISDTKMYTNTVAGFRFEYPAIATLSVDPNTGFDKISFPVDRSIATSTLGEKYITIMTGTSTASCAPQGDETVNQHAVVINGKTFNRVETSGVGAGNIYQNINYIVDLSPKLCANINLLVHSSNGGNYDPVRPNYNPSADFAQFDSIMKTLTFTK